jgi:O-acetyl-ADP-ribose deacetylase (regulator of RNase III)
MKHGMTCGFSVVAYTETLAGRDPAYVVIHKMGSEERSFLTPDEADRLAAVLAHAASVARQTS